MTRIGYVKPQMFKTPSRPSPRPPDNGYPLSKPSSCGLQSTARHVLPLSPGWDPGTSLGLFPFSAIITGRDDTRLPAPSLPAHRFSQPLSRSFVPHDSRVYSTPQALLGLWSSEFDPETIGYPCRTPCSCVVVPSSWLPSCIQMGTPMPLSTAVFPDLRTP
jgi:hypothetical protein